MTHKQTERLIRAVESIADSRLEKAEAKAKQTAAALNAAQNNYDLATVELRRARAAAAKQKIV